MSTRQNCTGNPVTGDDYFQRSKLEKKLWRNIENGNHILITAPRRIGKTSLLKYVEDNPKGNYVVSYMNLESVSSENEFFQRLYKKILDESFITKLSKATQSVFEFFRTKKLTGLGLEGISIDSEDVNYRETFCNLIKKQDLDGVKIILIIDEFPQVLENIIKYEGGKEGRHFLQTNREIRQDLEFTKKVQFIYTGSIGLENVARKIESFDVINDIDLIVVPQFTKTEGIELIDKLLIKLPYKLEGSGKEYIIQKIEWLIPFYIQLLLKELCEMHYDQDIEVMNEKHIDTAFMQMIKHSTQFEHWLTRLLSSVIDKNDLNFTKKVLNRVSEVGQLERNEIYDKAVKTENTDNYKNVLKILISDGYINT